MTNSHKEILHRSIEYSNKWSELQKLNDSVHRLLFEEASRVYGLRVGDTVSFTDFDVFHAKGPFFIALGDIVGFELIQVGDIEPDTGVADCFLTCIVHVHSSGAHRNIPIDALTALDVE